MASQEWYTSPWLTTKAQNVLGVIGLDPCSNEDKTVPAGNHYVGTQGANGLVLPWDKPTMFINPPWATIDPWVDRLTSFKGRAILLVPDRTDRPWYQLLLKLRVPLCMPKERVHYCKVIDGELVEKRRMNRGSTIFYWAPGRDPSVFRDEFAGVGTIINA